MYNNCGIKYSLNMFYKLVHERKITKLYHIRFDHKISKINSISKVIDKTITFNISFLFDNNEKTLRIHYPLDDFLISLMNKSSFKNWEKLVLYYIIFDYKNPHYTGAGPYYYKFLMNKYDSIVECFSSLHNHVLPNFYTLLDVENILDQKETFLITS